MNWNLFVTELVAGITHGSVYALIALGFSMVYGILKLLNFAHGDIYMIGSFIGYGLIVVFGGATHLHVNVVLLLTLMFLCAMLGGGLVGVMVERFAYRRLRNAPRIAPLITALGVSFFLENGAQLVLGAQFQSYDSFSWSNTAIASRHFTLPAHANVSYAQVIVVVGAIVLMVALTLFVQRTQTGKAMRATAFDREAAAMMGIDVDRVIVVAFFIGSALAGLGGVMGGSFASLAPGVDSNWLLNSLIVVIIGGMGSLTGAAVGALLLGLTTNFASAYLPSDYTYYSIIFTFVLLALVLAVRPHGLFGKAA